MEAALSNPEKKLYDAAATGDTLALRNLLKDDQLLLDRVSFTCANKAPLHVATMRGHHLFVHEILNLNPQLAEQLDSQHISPLHIATAKGYLEIVRELLSAAPEMCFSRDCQGRTPLHLAVINGHVQILEELLQQAPIAATEKVDRGGFTVLHLCAKYRQLTALKILLALPCLTELVDATGDDGDTVLHIAVRDDQHEMIQYLVKYTKVDVNAKNTKGQTAMDISQQKPNSEIVKILKPRFFNPNSNQTRPEEWITRKRDSIMVVAILIATMAFQAVLTPPGGLWQDDLNDNSTTTVSHYAGDAVFPYRNSTGYFYFISVNTIAFISSLSIILLLISGLPFKRRLFMWILMVIMWVTITCIALTYGIAIAAVAPPKDFDKASSVLTTGTLAWCGLMVILVIANTIRLIYKWLKKIVIAWRRRRFRDLV